jgi:hypothetical protein
MNSGSWYWPDLSDIDGAKDASRLGMWCAVIVAGITGLFALLALAGTSLMGVRPLSLVDAALFAGIAFGIHKYSRFAAVAGFALFLIEKIYQVIQQGPLGAGVLGIVFLIGFLNAMRGTFAYHKFVAASASPAPGTVPPFS